MSVIHSSFARLWRGAVNTAPDALKAGTKRVMYRLFLLSEKLFRGPFNKYDFQTFMVFRRFLRADSNCIDVGANVGHILREMIAAAPRGIHYAFEPIPDLFGRLRKRYGERANVFDCALSNADGESEFMYYANAPALSGFAQCDKKWGELEHVKLRVRTMRLDDVIAPAVRIDLIKIDVEGAELLVLEGAKATLQRNKPIVLFECGAPGPGKSSDTPERIFDLFSECGMAVGLIEYHLRGGAPFTRDEFCGQIHKGYNYFYIAYNPRAEGQLQRGLPQVCGGRPCAVRRGPRLRFAGAELHFLRGSHERRVRPHHRREERRAVHRLR